jgi:hypothetical protein
MVQQEEVKFQMVAENPSSHHLSLASGMVTLVVAVSGKAFQLQKKVMKATEK